MKEKFNPDTHRDDFTQKETELNGIRNEVIGSKAAEELADMIKKRDQLKNELEDMVDQAHEQASKDNKVETLKKEMRVLENKIKYAEKPETYILKNSYWSTPRQVWLTERGVEFEVKVQKHLNCGNCLGRWLQFIKELQHVGTEYTAEKDEGIIIFPYPPEGMDLKKYLQKATGMRDNETSLVETKN